MSLDVASALRTAIVANTTITNLITTYQNAPSVHTRVPTPDNVVLPYIVIGPDIAITDFDALTSRRPLVIRDVFVYGTAGSSRQDDYRKVETIGYTLRNLFHRNPDSITVDGYQVVAIEANGPRPAPTNDEEVIGRLVSLSIRLRSVS